MLNIHFLWHVYAHSDPDSHSTNRSPPTIHGLSITNLHLVVDRNIKRYEAELRLPGSHEGGWGIWLGILPGSVWSVEDPSQDERDYTPLCGERLAFLPEELGKASGERMFWFSHPKNAAPATLTSVTREASFKKRHGNFYFYGDIEATSTPLALLWPFQDKINPPLEIIYFLSGW